MVHLPKVHNKGKARSKTASWDSTLKLSFGGRNNFLLFSFEPSPAAPSVYTGRKRELTAQQQVVWVSQTGS